MALVQIQILPGGRVLWVKASAAAKAVAQGRAVYAATAGFEPAAILLPPETAALAPPQNAALPPARRRPAAGRP